MTELWDGLLACMKLDGPTADGDFEGKNLELEYHRLFGGQLLAQFIRAAELTCPDKAVKSLHVLFPREGTADEPVRYEVQRHHEGRTFGSLTVLARQEARGVIGTASVSVHSVPEPGGVAVQTADPVSGVPGDSAAVDIGMLPFETRTGVDLDSPEEAPAEFSLWWRTPAADPALAPALAAYATDLTLIGTALRAVDGVSQRDAQVKFASAVTSHTVWFHQPFRTDDWLLLRQESPILARDRSFGRGDILTADGTLVASYAQEAMVRFR
ncbi:MAG: thioesterase family protein [Streptosporangiales bacterium]|nr:thioesterase family protein [Streptosporangiales bacterium]